MGIGINLTKKEKTIRKMWEMVDKLYGNYSRDEEMKIWDLCYEWNSEHEDDEIFMCETGDEGNTVNGFMIEDDCFYYEDMMR